MILNSFIEESYMINSITYTPDESSKKLPFRLYGCGHFRCGDKYFTEREGLNNYLLVFTINGKGMLRYRNNEAEAVKNSCFLIHCKEYQYYYTAKEQDWEFYYLHFNGSSAPYFAEITNQNTLQIVSVQDSLVFSELFTELLDTVENQPVLSDINISLLITKLLTMLAKEYQRQKNHSLMKHRQEIETIRLYLEVNFKKETDVAELANQARLSKFYFLKLFKSLTGQSPYSYLIKVRVDASKKLLKQTDMSIGEVALEVGFQDVNNFIKTFKRLTGTTPLNFRLYWII